MFLFFFLASSTDTYPEYTSNVVDSFPYTSWAPAFVLTLYCVAGWQLAPFLGSVFEMISGESGCYFYIITQVIISIIPHLLKVCCGSGKHFLMRLVSVYVFCPFYE